MMRRKAFTLVELLVVIAVIAIVVALMLPVIQSARESARRVQCANNFKQVALAILNHASANDRLPGVYDSGFRFGEIANHRDPISWRYTVAPFTEDMAIFDVLQEGEWINTTLRQPRPSDPKNPAVSAIHLCPSTSGSPRFGTLRLCKADPQVSQRENFNRHGNIWGKPVFDAVAVADNSVAAVVSFARWPRPNISSDWEATQAGAWLGNSDVRDPTATGGQWSTHTGARLPWATDGLSKTILVREIAGRPMAIVGNDISDDVQSRESWLTTNSPFWHIPPLLPPINYTNSSYPS